jgi:D-alanyl-D-alanine carboxypeptidase
MMKKLLFALASILLLSQCETNTDPSKPQLADDYSNRVLKTIEKTVNEHNVPGTAVLIKFEDGSILRKAYGYGYISEDDSAEIRTTDLFRIGSVTKTFVASGILILVKDGIINLDDAVEKLLPDILKYGDEITLEMLLNQSSAITDYTWNENFADTYYYDPTYNWSKHEIIELFKDKELLDKPGKISYYSNSNYYLLGLIIEKYSGMSLAEYLEEKIFKPLGMNNTYLPQTTTISGDYCHGYFDINQDGKFEPEEDYTFQSPYAIWAAGGIVSTLDDMLIWIDELLTGSLLNEELQNKRMKIDSPLANTPDGIYYGLGISDIFGAIGHNGAVAGYTTILYEYKNTKFIAYGNGYKTTGNKPLFADDLFEKLKVALFEQDQNFSGN